MVMTDPVADMLTRIRNASKSYKEEVSIPASRVKADIARLADNGNRPVYKSTVHLERDGQTTEINVAHSPEKEGSKFLVKPKSMI